MQAGLALAFILLPGLGWAQSNSGLDSLTRRDEAFGWEAVGRIDIGDDGFCTGTLIATDLVLTAAHCLFDPQTSNPVDIAAIVFRAGLHGGDAIAEARVERAVAHPGYDPQSDTNAESVGHDLALLKLSSAIPAAVAAPFVVQDTAGVAEVSVVSFARGRDTALSWQRACKVLGRRGGLLAFDCDVDFGSSGAPVFDLSGARARIVSVVSAGRRDEDGSIVFGMELPGLLADLKSSLRSGSGVMTAASARSQPKVVSRDKTSRDIGARFIKP